MRCWRHSIWLLCLLTCGCANTWLLLPKFGAIDAHGATRRFIQIVDEKLEIFTSANSPTPRAYVLEFTGNATRAEQLFPAALSRWSKYPVELWAVNYPGYGKSSGPPRMSAIPKSALAAYDALRQRAGPAAPIFIAGNSLGTTAALYVATKRSCNGLLLQNPPPLKQLLLSNYGWWNLWLVMGPMAAQVPTDLDSLANAPKVHVPALFLTGQTDGLVPPRYHAMVIDAYRGPKRVVKSPLGHNSYYSRKNTPGFNEGIDWLWRQGGL
jgi:pimeloyl-ACP methyl ester carboxylesterase